MDQQQQEEMERAKKEHMARVAKYKAVFNNPTGKEVLNDLMNLFCFGNTTMSKGAMGVDPHLSMFKEGQRTVVLHILATTKLDLLDRAEDMIERQNERDA